MYTIKDDLRDEYQHYAALNSTDGYSNCVVQYAAQWGELMEQKIAEGAKLEEIAEQASHEVDRRPGFGITGFMYGCAVRELAKFWAHGDALRVWHNAQYSVKAEKGVANPAVLVVGAAPEEEN